MRKMELNWSWSCKIIQKTIQWPHFTHCRRIYPITGFRSFNYIVSSILFWVFSNQLGLMVFNQNIYFLTFIQLKGKKGRKKETYTKMSIKMWTVVAKSQRCKTSPFCDTKYHISIWLYCYCHACVSAPEFNLWEQLWNDPVITKDKNIGEFIKKLLL